MNDSFTINNLLSPSGPSEAAKKSSVEKQPRRWRGGRAILAFGKWLVIGAEPNIQLSSREQSRKHRRLAGSVGVIVLLLLAVSIGFGWRERRVQIRDAAYRQIAGRVEWVLSQSRDLSSVSPARARELITQERGTLEKEIEKITDESLKSRVSSLVDALSGAERSAGNIVAAAPDKFLDLNLIREGTNATAIGSNGTELFLLDEPAAVGLAVSMKDRSGSVIGGGPLFSGAIAIGGDSRNAYVLTPGAIVENSIAGHTTAPVVAEPEETPWRRPIRIGVFGGSLYVLDPDASEVFYYPVTDDGFGARRRWFAAGAAPDLTDAVDMQIDGDIWLLHRGGKIDRFRQGRPEEFRVSGLIDQFQEPVSLSVPADGTRVWILDRPARRVVALDRETGEYVGQWVIEGVDASGLVVNETLRSMFLLSGSSIYTIQWSP